MMVGRRLDDDAVHVEPAALLATALLLADLTLGMHRLTVSCLHH